MPIAGFGPSAHQETQTHVFGDTTLELDLCIVVDEPAGGGFDLAAGVQDEARDRCAEVSVAAGG
ncbi:hypothetical protein P0L94_16600 [Microbacter sp. GSS18]|nr:hypothetical protein P0L94_16600 [Microbacter sp. GSS18]